MKLTKKARVGLFGVITALLFCAVFFLNTGHSSALAFTSSEVGNTVLYEVINPSTIKANLPGKGEVTFVDEDPFDTNHNFDAVNYGCAGSSNDIKLTASDDIFEKGGVAPSSYKVIVQVQTKIGINESGCTGGESNADVTNRTSGLEKIRQYFTWVDSTTIKNTTGSNAKGSKDGDTYKKERTDSNVFYRTSDNSATCKDKVEISGSGSSATAIHTSYSGQSGQRCIIERINFVGVGSGNSVGRVIQKRGFTLANFDNANKPGETTSQTDTEDSPVTCETANDGLLGNILCPLINSIDGAANGLMNAVEDLLFVKPGELFTQQLKEAWGGMRVLATIAIVIVMLVMVFSQAISWGPFDAYTIKKLLPRLVIAVIAIQLSWTLSVTVINIFNQIGAGMADLLMAPFGGREGLSFASVLQAGGSSAGDFGFFTGSAISLAAGGVFLLSLGGGAAIGGVVLTILMLAIPAVVAILVGFLVLLARDILLILCVVLSPLAFSFWVLPGTRKYWNLWQETFGKLLLMFPIIMALIVVGRIFAFVTAEGYFKGSNDFLSLVNIFVVTIGFFGPFFLLPKAFQWGGSLLGKFAGIANDRNKGIFDRSRKGLEGWRDRSRGKAATGYNPNASIFKRAGTRIGAGTYAPTARSRQIAMQKGEHYESEQEKLAGALIQRAFDVRQDFGDVEKFLSSNNRDERTAALKFLAQRNQFQRFTNSEGQFVTRNKKGDEVVSSQLKHDFDELLGKDQQLWGQVNGSRRDLRKDKYEQLDHTSAKFNPEKFLEDTPATNIATLDATFFARLNSSLEERTKKDSTKGAAETKAAAEMLSSRLTLLAKSNPQALSSLLNGDALGHVDKLLGEDGTSLREIIETTRTSGAPTSPRASGTPGGGTGGSSGTVPPPGTPTPSSPPLPTPPTIPSTPPPSTPPAGGSWRPPGTPPSPPPPPSTI